jgi:hypothetical protein
MVPIRLKAPILGSNGVSFAAWLSGWHCSRDATVTVKNRRTRLNFRVSHYAAPSTRRTHWACNGHRADIQLQWRSPRRRRTRGFSRSCQLRRIAMRSRSLICHICAACDDLQASLFPHSRRAFRQNQSACKFSCGQFYSAAHVLSSISSSLRGALGASHPRGFSS